MAVVKGRPTCMHGKRISVGQSTKWSTTSSQSTNINKCAEVPQLGHPVIKEILVFPLHMNLQWQVFAAMQASDATEQNS